MDTLEALKNSNITPSVYTPSLNLKKKSHCAIVVKGNPILVTGLVGCDKSKEQAERLIKSDYFKLVASKVYPNEELTYSEIKGEDIDWQDKETSISSSKRGKVESGNEDGNLIWIILGKESLGIATALCVNSEIQDIAS